MEIRDPIHGPIQISRAEAAVIDSPFFQRLRRIKQLGFAELAFPGATHNRFLHSIGVMHLAGRAFDIIFAKTDWLQGAERTRLKQTLRLAALCHDIGHAPLSHTSESLFPNIETLAVPYLKDVDPKQRARHEHVSLKLLLDSPLHDTLKASAAELGLDPLHVAALLHSEVACDEAVFVVGGRDLKGVLSAIVSSELDVDRMDYLLRDSHYTGVSYGRFDHDWLLSHLTHYEREDGKIFLAIRDRAIYTFDDFLLSRYHMFLMVYFHSKVVCYDQMLQRFYHELPTPFSIPTEPEIFLNFDDAAIHRSLREQRDSSWARDIVDVRPLKLIAERGPHARNDPIEGLEERLQEAELDYLRVTSEGALSKYRGKTGDAREIYVRIQPRLGAAHFIPLREATQLFTRYTDATLLERIYVRAHDVPTVAKWMDALRALEHRKRPI